MVILVMHIVKLRSLFIGIQQLLFSDKKSHNKENCNNEALVNKRPLEVYLYKRFLSSPTVSHKRQYKCFRNKLNHLLRVTKRDYYDKKLTECKFNGIPGKFSMKLLIDVNVT